MTACRQLPVSLIQGYIYRYQDLVKAVLYSNHRMTEQGYDQALEAMIQGFSVTQISKTSNSRVTIRLPKYPNYYLLPGTSEEISATTLPGVLFGSGADLINQFGTVDVLIASRTATYSGTFFSGSPKTDDHILSAESWTVSIQLTVDKWADDLFNTPWRQRLLIDTVFNSNKNSSNTGYEAAMMVQRGTVDGSGDYKISLVQENSRRLTLSMPSLPDYRLPSNPDLMSTSGAEVPLLLLPVAAVLGLLLPCYCCCCHAVVAAVMLLSVLGCNLPAASLAACCLTSCLAVPSAAASLAVCCLACCLPHCCFVGAASLAVSVAACCCCVRSVCGLTGDHSYHIALAAAGWTFRLGVPNGGHLSHYPQSDSSLRRGSNERQRFIFPAKPAGQCLLE